MEFSEYNRKLSNIPGKRNKQGTEHLPLLEDTQGKQPVPLQPISGQLHVFLLRSNSNSFFEI
jgi:hypothetical protein